MPRPRKKAADRKDYHLRVPLTAAQLAVIEEAVRVDAESMAGWARAVLLATARKRIEKAKARKVVSDPT